MSKNIIRVVRHQDFKKTVETVLGYPIRHEDVEVVSFDDKPFSKKVSSIDLTDFIFKMVTFNKENNITSNDVAIITQEDLVNQEKSISKNTVSHKSKFGNK